MSVPSAKAEGAFEADVVGVREPRDKLSYRKSDRYHYHFLNNNPPPCLATCNSTVAKNDLSHLRTGPIPIIYTA